MSMRLELSDLPHATGHRRKSSLHREGAGAKLHLHRWKPL